MKHRIRILVAHNHRSWQVPASACWSWSSRHCDRYRWLALVQAARSLKPDGVVVSSPDLDGLNVAERLKRKLPSLELKFLIAKSAVHRAAKTAPEIAPQTFAFQKYNMREQSRDHHQGRIASIRHERQYGANA